MDRARAKYCRSGGARALKVAPKKTSSLAGEAQAKLELAASDRSIWQLRTVATRTVLSVRLSVRPSVCLPVCQFAC